MELKLCDIFISQGELHLATTSRQAHTRRYPRVNYLRDKSTHLPLLNRDTLNAQIGGSFGSTSRYGGCDNGIEGNSTNPLAE